MSADPPGTKYGVHGPYVPLCEENDCRDDDPQMCGAMRGDFGPWDIAANPALGCSCKLCHREIQSPPCQ